MVINDLIVLKNLLKDTKLGKVSNEVLRTYLKLSVKLNEYNTAWEDKRRALFEETAKTLGYDMQTLTEQQNNEVFNIAAPLLNDYLGTEVTDFDTHIFSWDDLFNFILNVDENSALTTEQKTLLTTYLCAEEL